MTDEPKRATAAEIAAALIDQSNALIIAQDVGLQQSALLIAAGLFAIASAISETKTTT